MQNDEKDKILCIRVALDDLCMVDIKQAFVRLIDMLGKTKFYGNCLSFEIQPKCQNYNCIS